LLICIWLQGEFQTDFKAILTCNSTEDIMFNYYLYKIAENITELRGNISNKIPLDDSLTVSSKNPI